MLLIICSQNSSFFSWDQASAGCWVCVSIENCPSDPVLIFQVFISFINIALLSSMQEIIEKLGTSISISSFTDQIWP